MKKTIKILLVVCVLLSVFCTTISMAAASGVSPKDYTGTNTGDLDVGSVEKVGNQIIKIVSTIGSIASVIVLVILGLKYMMGSAEEKAEYKKTLLPYVIGAALVFAASTIATVVYNFTSNIG